MIICGYIVKSDTADIFGKVKRKKKSITFFGIKSKFKIGILTKRGHRVKETYFIIGCIRIEYKLSSYL